MAEWIKTLLAGFAICVIILFSSMSHAQGAPQAGHINLVDLSESKNLYVIQLSGAIYKVLEPFTEALSTVPDGAELLLHLNSPGGQDRETYELIALLDQAQERLKSIDTTVENGNACASATTRSMWAAVFHAPRV